MLQDGGKIHNPQIYFFWWSQILYSKPLTSQIGNDPSIPSKKKKKKKKKEEKEALKLFSIFSNVYCDGHSSDTAMHHIIAAGSA